MPCMQCFEISSSTTGRWYYLSLFTLGACELKIWMTVQRTSPSLHQITGIRHTHFHYVKFKQANMRTQRQHFALLISCRSPLSLETPHQLSPSGTAERMTKPKAKFCENSHWCSILNVKTTSKNSLFSLQPKEEPYQLVEPRYFKSAISRWKKRKRDE